MNVAKVRNGSAREAEPGRRDADRKSVRDFDDLVGQPRRRPKRGKGDGSSEPPVGEAPAVAMLLAALGGGQLRAATSQPAVVQSVTEDPGAAESDRLFLQRFEEAGGSPESVQLPKAGALAGNELRLRIASGPWQGLELQATLHAGSIALTLRPAQRKQQERLQEASGQLSRELGDYMGMPVQMEVRNATR